MLRSVDVESAAAPTQSQISCGNNVPEISPQIHNLPSAQPYQHSHSPKSKPFDSLIRALVRVPKLLFSRPEVVHLPNDLPNQLFNASQLRLYRFQLLLCLDSRPVSGVGANIYIQLDVAGGTSSSWIILAPSDLGDGGTAYERRRVGFRNTRRTQRRRVT